MLQTISAIALGVIASLIAWWAVNILFIPTFDISELSYNNNKSPYVKIWNKSWHGLNIYDVKCYISYYNDKSERLYFMREDSMKPLLPKGSRYVHSVSIKLGGDERLSDFFTDGNRLVITITGQNRFGVKQVEIKEIVIKNTPIDDDNC